MEPEIGVVQILPQPRQPLKAVIWTIYSVISVGLIVTIAAVLSNQSDKPSQEETPSETTTTPIVFAMKDTSATSQVSQETTTTTVAQDNVPRRRVLLGPYAGNKSRSGRPLSPRPKQLVIITLEEVVAYECYFEAGIKDVTWLRNSDVEIVYRDGHLGDKAIVMDVTDGLTYPASNLHDCHADGRRVLKSGNHEDDLTTTSEDDPATLFQQHVATTWNCYRDPVRQDAECRYSVRILSSATDKGPTRSAVELVSTELSQGRQRYGYVRRGPISHRRTYSIKPVGNEEISDNASLCTMKTLEEYDLTWNSQWIQPKYTFSVSEACPTHRLSWTDEFTFDSVEHQYRDVRLPTTFHLYPVTGESITRRDADKANGKLSIPQHDHPAASFQTMLGSIVQSPPASSYQAPSIDRRRSAENNEATRCVPLMQQRGTTADSNSGAGDCEGERRPHQRVRTPSDFVAETSALDRRHVQEASGDGPRESNYARRSEDIVGGGSRSGEKRKRARVKYAFESARIGKTPWILHTIVHFSSLHNISVLNMAISRSNTLNRESKTHEVHHGSGNWNPRSSRLFKPLLADDLYVTRILAAKVDSEDEATAYFVAAPVANVSRRFLYKMKVVYPPLEYPTLEPVRCLTCLEENNPMSLKERVSRRYPRCIWSDVLMSHTAENYILNCRGPKLPWTAIISTPSNRIIRRLDTWSEFRSWHRSKSHPQQHEFELGLKDGFQARVSLHVPFDWKNKFGECRRKLRLLLRLANEQDGQLVNAQFDLSLTTFLTGVKGYAVIYSSSELVTALRKKLYKRQYLSPLTRRLRGRNFALLTEKSKHGARHHYEDNLLGLLVRHGVEFEHRRYGNDCSSRLGLYEDLSSYFDRCFERQYTIRGL
ncbi:uncharacterized protein LOC103317425 isoform X3 [Nasonia vitripennis]|uniref:Uncharacterized protein n=1 Tax=Nasonia vitripennis TaxID=7425 RepID=A0A7M7Q9J8_NASVI|nr:uncharacterized protein LOC103317425 isoform X3 [Nasonia vitripennis]